MEGGVAIFLLLIILGVGAVIGGGLYFTGAVLSLRRGGSDDEERQPRPTAERPGDAAQDELMGDRRPRS